MKRLLCNVEEEDTYFLPDELWWTIFSLLSERWQLHYPHCVSRSWSALARNEMMTVGYGHLAPQLNDALLARAPNVKSLRLLDYHNDFVSMGALAPLSGLTRLELRGNVGSFPSHLLTHMQKLLSLTMVNNIGIALPLLTALKSLDLSGACNVFDEDIRRLTGLDTLVLHNCPYLTAKCLHPLTALRQLNVEVHGLGDETLSLMTNLVVLGLDSVTHTLTDASLSKLTCLKELCLDFPSVEITHASLLNLPVLTYLTTWGIHPHLDVSRLVTLRKLTLHCNLTDVADLSPLTNLTDLTMSGKVCLTKSLLASLVSLRALEVTHLVLHRTVTLQDLRRLTKLWALGRDQRNLTDIGKLYQAQ